MVGLLLLHCLILEGWRPLYASRLAILNVLSIEDFLRTLSILSFFYYIPGSWFCIHLTRIHIVRCAVYSILAQDRLRLGLDLEIEKPKSVELTHSHQPRWRTRQV